MRVLIVGLGSIGKKHVKAIFEVYPMAAIYALRSKPSAEKVDGVTNIFDYAQIPHNIDFSIIANPTYQHLSTLFKLKNLGKPIMIEKPILSKRSEIDELLLAFKNIELKTYVACNMRFHPVIQFLKKELTNKPPLELNIYCGSFLPDWRVNKDYRKVYSANHEMGGGVHLDLIHEIDYTVFLLGMPKFTQRYVRKKSNLEITSMDVAHYCLEYPSTSVFITLNYYRKMAKRTIDIVWEDTVWSVDLLKASIINENGEHLFSKDFDMAVTYREQIRYFWTTIKTQKKPMNNYQEAIDVLELVLA